MHVYALKTCDTCRRALKELRAAGHAPEVTDVRADELSQAEVAGILAAFGDRAINRASATWRGLSDEERAAPPEVLLRAHPTLMKRPVIRNGTEWHLGWTPEVRAAVL